MALPQLRPVALSVLVAVSTAQAEESSLPPVNVTAKGYARADIDTPNATLTLTRDDIAEGGAQNVGEALKGHPGLAVNVDGAWGQNPVIRGLKRESIVLLGDGIRVNSAQPYGAVASMFQLDLLERVEVVRGPASVVHGSGALGGVVNLIGPQARFGTGLTGDFGLGYDSVSKGGYGSAKANYGDERQALMVAAGYRDMGDYKSPDGTVDRTGYESQSVIAQYRLMLGDRTSLRLGIENHIDRDVWFPGSSQRPAQPPGLGMVTIHSPQNERTRYDAGIEYKSGGEDPLNLQATVYRQEVERQINAWSSSLQRDRVRTDVSFDTNGALFKGDWLAFPQHLLSFGIDGWQTKSSPQRYIDGNPPLYNSNTFMPPFVNGRLNAVGVYAQDEWSIGDFKLSIGGRYDRVGGDADSYLVPKVTPPQGFTSSSTNLERTDGAFSWSLGGLWQPSPAFVPYLSFARAFRAPDLRERFESSERGDGYFYFGNPQVEPETAFNSEIGLKGTSSDFSYTLSAYYNRISDYLAGRVTGQTFQGLPVKMTENIGRASIKGFEAEGRYRLAGSQYLLAGFSVLRGWNSVDNEPLPRMPADEMSLGWEGGIAPGWTLDARLRLVASQDRVASKFTRGTENPTAGFGTADIGATWRINKRNTLRAAIRNLADKAYVEPLTEGVSGYEILAPGRNLQLSWRGSF